MSGKDHDQIDDAEFAAFLQGSDPLAQDLAALDQPAPLPALDAAIQARIAAALAAERLAELPAANDPLVEPAPAGIGHGAAPRWQSRWQLPLALAAGVAAISIALPLWQVHDPVTAPMLATAPPAPAPAPAAPPAEMADAAPPPKAAPERRSAATSANTMHAKAAPEPEQAPVPYPAPEPAATGFAAAPPPPPMLEPGAPLPPARSGTLANVLVADAASADTLLRKQRLENAIAKVESQAKTARSAALMDYRVAPAASPSPAPAPAKPVTPSIAEPAPLSERVAISGSRIMTPAEDALRAGAWLLKIEDLLKANERPEALAEWRKFRAIYPDYPVPDKLAANFPPVQN